MIAHLFFARIQVRLPDKNFSIAGSRGNIFALGREMDRSYSLEKEENYSGLIVRYK